jgi:ribosomal protein L30/L7E
LSALSESIVKNVLEDNVEEVGIWVAVGKLQTLEALGLKKRFQTTYKPVNPQIAGQLLRVKELLDLQLAEEPVSKGGSEGG